MFSLLTTHSFEKFHFSLVFGGLDEDVLICESLARKCWYQGQNREEENLSLQSILNILLFFKTWLGMKGTNVQQTSGLPMLRECLASLPSRVLYNLRGWECWNSSLDSNCPKLSAELQFSLTPNADLWGELWQYTTAPTRISAPHWSTELCRWVSWTLLSHSCPVFHQWLIQAQM